VLVPSTTFQTSRRCRPRSTLFFFFFFFLKNRPTCRAAPLVGEIGVSSVASGVGRVACVDAGTIYRIAVDGYEGAWGGFNLELHTSRQRLPDPPQAAQPQFQVGKHRPRTKIARRHVSSRRRLAVFHLGSAESGSHFLRRLDARSFRVCHSTVIYRRLKPGRHVFASKAVNPSGESGQAPAVLRFRLGSS
jgi:hypothetical protein